VVDSDTPSERISDPRHTPLDTQVRLRKLLEANRIVVEELDMERLLRRVAEAAITLVDARFGALGVVAPDGSLEHFIQVGTGGEQAAMIGRLPQGRSLFGAVIDERRAIRLDHLADDPRSADSPLNDPPIDGFLDVPIRVRDEVFGNLYLADRVSGGSFAPDDEELVAALAATAGIAIENARLNDDSRRRQRWSAALAEVTSALLSGGSDDVLGIVADRVASVIDVDLVCVVVPAGEGALRIEVARGDGAEHLLGGGYAAANSLVAAALESGRVTSSDGQCAELDGQPSPGPMVAIPLTAFDRPLGALTISRSQPGARFTPTDLEMAADFAVQASVAIELARGRADRQKWELVEERNRIAGDLHDHVIQQLLGSALSLQALASTVSDPLRAGIVEQVDAIDAAITEIRTAVFALNSRTVGSPELRPAGATGVDVAIAVDEVGVAMTIGDDGQGIQVGGRPSGTPAAASGAAIVTRVFLVDDHEIVRRGIADIIDAESDFEVVGEAATVRQALGRVAATLPDVVVLDVRLPDGSGIDLCRSILSANPTVRCLMLTAYDDDRASYAAVLAGASGYVLKDIQGQKLVEGIRAVAAGRTLVPRAVSDKVLEALTAPSRHHELPDLSLRERQVLTLIAKGLTNRQIGDRLGLAEKTVKNYVSDLLAKLGMERRTQAAVYAAKLDES
jgi:DNA-binding NarL/FixJ family response regulator/GAF domain-containing protein